MPILLDTMTIQSTDDSANASAKVVYSPKFFDDAVMTGVGKKRGNLCEARNPAFIPATVTTTQSNINTLKKSFTNGQTHVTMIPVNPLSAYAWSYMYEYDFNLDNATKIGEHKDRNGNVDKELYIYMMPHSVIYEDTSPLINQGGASGHTKKFTVCYQVFFFHHSVNYGMVDKFICQNITGYSCIRKYGQNYSYEFTCNPMAYINNQIPHLKQHYTIDLTAIDDFMQNYSLYLHMCDMSEIWQTTIDKYIDQLCYNVSNNFSNAIDALNYTSDMFHIIAQYNVPLDLYKPMYASVQTHFPADIAETLCKQNLNLLLSNTLNTINANKVNFTCCPAAGNMNISRFSPEQQLAITTTEPLVLVQAGAGTGKSTVILGRVDWMINAGCNPEDITVLSFTNAAADNITDRNPNIHSMTIARMVHEIYSLNFPTHELSSIDTMMNVIDIYYDNTHPLHQIAERFKRHLSLIKSNDNDAFTNMNNFVEKNYDQVIQILDTIKQTCLEMEIIICYQKIDTLQEPVEIQSKYLIIDEVQDNSIFEFIYTLKYINKHNESMFIVGDCSQTLYEFRASNPKALNVLESSGVFATYQLQINYRSNQEILDFANVGLSDIEANQYAHIQLRANSRATVTEQSFKDAVHFHYEELPKIGDFDEALGPMMANHLQDYLADCMARGEQVAFLAYSRRNCAQMQEEVEKMFPGCSCVSIIPSRMYNDTTFSAYIHRYWNQIQFAPTANIISVIEQDIYSKAQYFVRGDVTKALPSIQRMCGAWRQQYTNTINSWYGQYVNHMITQKEFLTLIRDCMLDFEIQNNAIKQSLLSNKNKEQKLSDDIQNANFLFSTIHSAKGLEFDNVVVLYRSESGMEEDKKRMYYVACTRAMKSEFILAYDTQKYPTIEANYKMLIKAYQDRDAAALANAAATGTAVASSSDVALTETVDCQVDDVGEE